MVEKPTSKSLVEALRRHHQPPPSKPIGGVLLVEVQSADTGRRADALWVPVNTARRGTLDGYEVKVSRADVVQELRDPMKADAWQRQCDRWWLVVPDLSLIAGLDIPEQWGIMTPPTATNRRTMTVIRQAPSTGRRPSAEAWGEVMAKIVYGGEDLQARLTRAEANAKHWEKQLAAVVEDNRQLRRQGALLPADEQDLQERVRSVVAEIERLSKHDPNLEDTWAWAIKPEDIARTILATQSHERSTKHLDSTVSSIRRDIDRLTRAATALAEVGTPASPNSGERDA